MSDYVPWLRELAADGGKGIVHNVDARSLGRIADEIERLRAENERLRGHIYASNRPQPEMIAEMLAALEEMVRWMPSKFAPQAQAAAMNMAEAAIRKARGQD